MSGIYDVFFSYRRKDLSRARPLLDALEAAGVRVWRDQTDLPDNAPITAEIRQGLASSKALIAFYSPNYPLSRPCQQEITAAWIAAQQMGEQPCRRVLVINPEASFEHLPKVLSEQQSMGWPADPAEFATLAAKIRRHVDSLEGLLAGAGAPVMPVYHGMAPVEATRFVGRVRELWDLHGQLTAKGMSIITGVVGQAAAQVRGLGGNGKSLLAREYAIRFGAAYPGGVFWLNAYGNDDTKGPLDPEAREALRQDQIRGFAVCLGVQVEGLAPEAVETALWRRLEGGGRPCLWIVDDLPSGLELEEIEKRWNSQWGGASTLITTRSAEYRAVGGHLDLDVLSEDEAWQLLTAHRKPQGTAEEDAARQIARELGCHPLAIEVAGSFLAKGTQSLGEYLEELSRRDVDAVEFGAELRESLPTGHERSISGTLLKSIRLLGEEGTDFLRLASMLAVAPIPVRLVEAVFERAGTRAADRMLVLAALDQADSLSLCTRAGDDARSVHTLVSRTFRYHTGNDQRTALLRIAAMQALSGLLIVVTDVRLHAHLEREIVHARHLVSAGIQTPEEVLVAAWVGRHDYERGDYVGARKLLEQALEVSAALVGDEHPVTLTVIASLAATLRAQGDLATARRLFERVLETHRRLSGEEHPTTLTARHNFAETLYAQGDLGGARKLQEQVLEASRRVLGDVHSDTLIAQINLAQSLHAQGDLAGARRHQEEVLGASRRLLGDEHPYTLTVRNNLAQTLRDQGDLAGAQELEEHVLDARRRLLGEEHPNTLGAMANLAGTLCGQGDLIRARKLQQQVLEASRRLLGDEHPASLRAMANLAVTLARQGELADARRLEERVLQARRRLLGEEHAETSIAAWNLFRRLRDSGEDRAAKEVLEEDLLWLLDRDAATLAGVQQKIRRRLSDLLGPPGGT